MLALIQVLAIGDETILGVCSLDGLLRLAGIVCPYGRLNPRHPGDDLPQDLTAEPRGDVLRECDPQVKGQTRAARVDHTPRADAVCRLDESTRDLGHLKL